MEFIKNVEKLALKIAKSAKFWNRYCGCFIGNDLTITGSTKPNSTKNENIAKVETGTSCLDKLRQDNQTADKVRRVAIVSENCRLWYKTQTTRRPKINEQKDWDCEYAKSKQNSEIIIVVKWHKFTTSTTVLADDTAQLITV